MLRHLALVRYIAKRVRRRAPHLELDELVSAGTIGLIEALDRFDDERGVPFASFAYPRIRGAILDDARASGALGPPGQADGTPTEVLSLEGSSECDDGGGLADVLADPRAPAPLGHAEFAELIDAFAHLPRRERAMLALATRGHEVGQIARLYGCSDSRASQLLTKARLRLVQRTAA